MKPRTSPKEQRILQNTLSKWLPALGQSAILLGVLTAPASAFNLKVLGTYSSGYFNQGGSEISAYDPKNNRLFVTNAATNTIDILNISNPTTPSKISQINFDTNAGRLTSVAFNSTTGMLAASLKNVGTQPNSTVKFFNTNNSLLNPVSVVSVGAGTDMITFTPDGSKLLTADEGEPNNDYTVDLPGSVSIIDVSTFQVKIAGFNGVPLLGPVRTFGPNAAHPELDLEPEYIAVSADSNYAWVTLQENNAIGFLNLGTGLFEKVVGLGYKNHNLPGNGLDGSDKDGKINIQNYAHLFGMYQPDNLATYTVNGKTYLVTANEGDARQYDPGFNEEVQVKNLKLDPTVFPNAAQLQSDLEIGPLLVTNTLGYTFKDVDGDGQLDKVYSELYAFGGRSFSIWQVPDTLNSNSPLPQEFDSGDQFEKITANPKIFAPANSFFNSNNTANNFDNRSDNKGPEPEALTIGTLAGRTLAFIGLERIGGIMTYDITDPKNPVFLNYVNNRNFLADPKSVAAGDLGPEGLLWIDPKDSPNGRALLVATNEVSGTTTIYEAVVPEPSIMLGALSAAAFLFGNKRRKK
ncbi:choice-of-anchor I family protein [Gloeothece verrucosa]|uniref:Alkaline phosphatase-like protein n=1 Tax=Gloeothece verrucosa (strain PCC 7822) TaxID=497965 RepID=E0UHY6_GLOV7|nr:choice-of-anchor I family protein [Gloeothece verrucosa]ADN14516.1 alkaline phosphatase-like protein [Gloeothece verrucosa PCC 7822]